MKTLTVGKINLIRYWVRVETLIAVAERREYSPIFR